MGVTTNCDIINGLFLEFGFPPEPLIPDDPGGVVIFKVGRCIVWYHLVGTALDCIVNEIHNPVKHGELVCDDAFSHPRYSICQPMYKTVTFNLYDPDSIDKFRELIVWVLAI